MSYIYIYMKHVFNEQDYNSKNGMITYVWGPLLWHFLHMMSFNYPTDPEKYNKEKGYKPGFIQNCYYLFVRLLQYVLPCGACRDNLVKNFEILKFKENKKDILFDRGTFSKFIFDLHETVNKYLKKESNLKYEDIKDFYEHFRASCPKKTNINNNKHSGCTKLKHGKTIRRKPKVVIYFVPFEKKIETTKVNEKCEIKCVHNK